MTQSEGDEHFHLIFKLLTHKQSHSAQSLHMKLACFAQTIWMAKVMRHWKMHTGPGQPTAPSLNTTVHKEETVTSTKYTSSAFTAILRVQVNIHRARPYVRRLTSCPLSSSVAHRK